MKVLSENKASYIMLEVDDTEPVYYPSFNLYVGVSDNGFSGEHDVWISQQDWEAFIAQLRQCEQSRQGQALLSKLEELELRIARSDGWGHFRLHYQLKRMGYSAGQAVVHSLAGEFDLDAELFAQTVSEFVSLFPDTVA